jgi:hypothetical protein
VSLSITAFSSGFNKGSEPFLRPLIVVMITLVIEAT